MSNIRDLLTDNENNNIYVYYLEEDGSDTPCDLYLIGNKILVCRHHEEMYDRLEKNKDFEINALERSIKFTEERLNEDIDKLRQLKNLKNYKIY